MAPYRAPVAQVYVSVGQRVKAGDVLLELSNPTAQAAYEQARRELKSVQAAPPGVAVTVEEPTVRLPEATQARIAADRCTREGARMGSFPQTALSMIAPWRGR